jgi:uncharacterized protein YbjQ (UPF0145 family)
MTVQQNLGVAFGLVVRSMGMVRGLSAGFKALRQGEVSEYTELLEDSRRHAAARRQRGDLDAVRLVRDRPAAD